MIQHGCDSVESEAIKLIFFDPHGKIGEQETPGFPVFVIKKTTIPQTVVSPRPGMEETAISAIK